MLRINVWVVAILSLLLAFSPGAAWAVDGEALLDILREEKVITVDQAEKMKKKIAKIEKEKKLDWKVYWNNGLYIESKDGKNKINIGGRTQVDFGSLSSPRRSLVDQLEAERASGDLTGFGTEFRRARLHVEGTVYDIIQFKAEYDFAEGRNQVGFKDVWVGLTKVPYVGHIRIGHQKEPFSLEELTSSRFITFMERALPNVFSPARNTGILVFNTAFKSKRLWWGVGVFQDTPDVIGDSYNNFQDWNFTARLAGTPIYLEEGRKLLHLGLGYSHQFRNKERFDLQYRQRPEFHITDVRPVDTRSGGLAALDAGGVDLLNPEMALVWGPFSLQGEYIWSFVDANRRFDVGSTTNLNLFLKKGNPVFHGGYIYASYFLTGEHRNYRLSGAVFDRIKPKRNFDLKGGPGAWEIAFRYSYLSLNDKVSSDPVPPPPGTRRVGVRGGIENNLTVALNWYPTPNTRWMLNYVYADIDNLRVTRLLPAYNQNFNHGPLHIVQTRFQIDF